MAEGARQTYCARLAGSVAGLFEAFAAQARCAGLEKAILAAPDNWRQDFERLAQGLALFFRHQAAAFNRQRGNLAVSAAPPEVVGSVAARHGRGQGLSLASFFSMAKCLRRPFFELLYDSQPDSAELPGLAAELTDFFDRFEAGAIIEWQEQEVAFYQRKLREAKHFILQEKKRYATVFYKMAEPAFVIDQNMRLVDANDAFEKFFGVGGEAWKEKSCLSLLGKHPGIAEELERVLTEHASFPNIEVAVPVRGEEKTILLSGVSLGYVRGEFAGAVLIMQDITAQKRVESALQKSEEKYRTLIENMPDVTWRADQEGRYLFISPNVTRICGFTPQEMSKINKFDRIHPEDAAWVREEYDSLFSGAGSYDVRYRFQCKDGEWLWLHGRAGAIRQTVEERYADGVFSDVTELQLVEEELDEYRLWLEYLVEERTAELHRTNQRLVREIEKKEKAREELLQLADSLKRSNTELEQFAHVASHDMKEPLLLIVAFSERLLARCGETMDSNGLEYLGRILKAARQLQQLVDDLLQLSRIRMRGEPFQPLKLAEVLQEVLEDLEEQILCCRGTVNIAGLPDLEADRVQMRQLFQNIIGNALKYRKKESDPVISIRSEVFGDEFCEITVEDNGIGFDEKYLSRIFRPFERLHGRGEYEGTGIGLATCEKIAMRHGGEITARSVPGQGAAFVVRLPLRRRDGAE